MKQEFIRIQATDGIEMCGILFSPEDNITNKVVVHVHGLAGNFFENRFVSYLAETYVNNGYSFLIFNNRGYGYYSDLLKGKETIVSGGSAYEIFEECIYDIEGTIKYLEGKGYNEFILQGHSYGCNKVVYSYDLLKNKYNFPILILLAPCDCHSEFKREIKDFDDYINECNDNIKSGNKDKIIQTDLFPMLFTSNTFINNFDDGRTSDIFKYRDKEYINNILGSINIPVKIVIGTDDECVYTTTKENVEEYLNNNIHDIDISYINNSNHVYKNYENELQKTIENIVKEI